VKQGAWSAQYHRSGCRNLRVGSLDLASALSQPSAQRVEHPAGRLNRDAAGAHEIVIVSHTA
jgi:hypothetical protein